MKRVYDEPIINVLNHENDVLVTSGESHETEDGGWSPWYKPGK